MSEQDEMIEVVNEQGEVIRLAKRSECHSNPGLIHRVVHVLVCNDQGDLYLQKRGEHKDIQPGKWDTSVGGHLCPGEQKETGAYREMEEELGIGTAALTFMYQYLMQSPVETELVYTYRTIWNGPVFPNPEEIDRGRFWSMEEIESALGTGRFTPNFEDEFRRYQDWLKDRLSK